MAVLSRFLTTAVTASLLSTAFASPSQIDTIRRLLGRDTFEWTALGDSYSSGVGADGYTSNSYRCLRYDHAYPVLINGDQRLPEGDHKFNNVVCSGSNTKDIEAYQFYDEPTSGTPNSQFGDRPEFGKPSMASLSVGGNDIDFPGIIFNCILEWNLPVGGPPKRSCDDQKVITWNLLVDPNLAEKISGTIKKVVDKGREGPIGNDFKLYVTGFPQFFSTETTECDDKTFARNANPNPDGKEHVKLTQDIRKEYNDMSVQLNKAIESAVKMNENNGVHWIPIDPSMEGHRFCEPGVVEPDQHNDDLWLYHYPYNEPESSDIIEPLQNAAAQVTLEAGQSYSEYENQVYEAVDLGDPAEQGIFDGFWSAIGHRVKVFHPQVKLHEKIRDLVLDQYISDLGEGQDDEPQPEPEPPKQDENKCHGIGGDYWVMSRDVAVENVKEFCQGDGSKTTFNQDSVNELELVVRKDGEEKPARDSPDCEGRFTRAVIDGCDGNDPVNNPHNYKFGSTLEAGDGWSYTMTPLSKQVNEVSCDVSYKFLWNEVEIRGKNLPDAKLGAEGEGLYNELDGCGTITEWKFERTPDDVRFQWYARCRLEIGTKACVGRALESAGGSGKGNCHGAGKRGWAASARSIVANTKRDSIDDWPGYGDEGRHVFASDVTAPEKRDSIDDWPGYGDEGRHIFASDASQ